MEVHEGLTKIFEDCINQWGNFQGFSTRDPENRTFPELADIFLSKKKHEGIIQDYTMDTCSFDCGPASEPGACFIAWIDKHGKLESTTYDWEN